MCFFKVINPDILPHSAEPDSTPGTSAYEDAPMHTPTADGYEFDINPCCIKKPLVIFIGGFGDEMFKVMLETCEDYKKQHSSYQDIYYRPHDQGEVVLDFVEKYAAAGQKIAIIGHSWGGNTAVNRVAMKTNSKIDILATLDPVDKLGKGKAPSSKPANVLEYINVYINYVEAEMSNLANSVARTGGPWQNVPCADINYDIINETRNNQYGRLPDHADASWMFTKYIQRLVKDLR